jgi:hypothetical protein
MARKTDRMSDRSYQFMVWLFKPIDFLESGDHLKCTPLN